MEFTCTYSSINFVNKFKRAESREETETWGGGENVTMKEKARKREKGGGGEERVSIREWNKSMWESIVNFPFGNCSAVNWHEWSTIAATTTTHYSVRLTFKTNISMRLCGDTNGLKKKKKKMVDYAHEILLLAHIFQIILLQKWNMQMLKVFEWFFPPWYFQFSLKAAKPSFKVSFLSLNYYPGTCYHSVAHENIYNWILLIHFFLEHQSYGARYWTWIFAFTH